MKIFKPFFIILTQLLVSIFLVEIASYYFLLYSNNALYRARHILQADSQLAWMARPHLNTTFEKTKVITNNEGFRTQNSVQTYSILTLGPSSAFGWGVEAEQTYSYLLAEKLQKPLLNASQIGYSIVQGHRLWNEKIKSISNTEGYALIAYGVNDLDKFRFYTIGNESDLKFFQKAPIQFSSLVQNEKSSNLITLISLAAHELSLKKDCGDLKNIEQRVSLAEYETELRTLIDEVQAKKLKPILVNTPYYLKQKNPAYTESEISRRYELVMQAANSGQCSEALKLLAEAKALEPDRVTADVIKLNEIIKKVANEKHLIYVDTFTLLNGDDKKIGSNYVDPIHPSVAGHKLIAEDILKQIKN